MTSRTPTGGPWSPADMQTIPDEVEQRLDRYAAEGLAPDPDQIGRVRAALLSEIAARGPVQSAPRGIYRPLFRRWMLAAASAVLLVGGTGLVAAESGPGQPFYGLRLAVGSVTLSGEQPARDRGLAAQLTDRLAEAGVASRNGDSRGAEAAIDAYLQTLTELTRNNISDPAVLDVLQRHVDTLEELLSSAPPQAAGGLQQALDAAGHASGVTAPPIPSTVPHPTPPQNPRGSTPPTGKP